MLSQQDMEDFMNVEAVLNDQDQDAAKPEKPSSTIQGGTSAGDEVRTVPDLQRMQQGYLQEGMRSLLSTGDQVSELLAQVTRRS
jgi:hypothetical protein